MSDSRRRDGFDLTPRARELLVYIQTRDLCPSVDEMRQALRLDSKSGIIRLLGQLEERGYIRRLHRRARAIEVLKPAPPLPAKRKGLRIVFGPDELAGRARMKRRLWANEDRKALLGKGRG